METKQVKIIPLAKKKIAQRGVDESMVLETVYKPHQIVRGHGGRNVAQRQYQISNTDYLLRVVYEEGDDEIVVITGYLTSQISRYWELKQ
jgi:hypothetical protein